MPTMPPLARAASRCAAAASSSMGNRPRTWAWCRAPTPACRSVTTAAAWTPAPVPGCSSPSSPPRRPARAPVWACRWCMALCGKAAAADAAAPATPVPSDPAAGLALLVDDDLQVRITVRRLLLDLGYAVLEAENGAEAKDILDQTPGIQLLLSDIVMPGAIDGRQLARYARQSGEVAHILLMSGYAAETESPLDAPLLAKPFGKAELSAALREIGA